MTTVALGEVVDFCSGGTPAKMRPEFWTGDVPWFSAKDLKRSRLSDSADHISDGVFDETPLRKVPAGTVVMVVRGMILAHTIPISILDVDAAINQDLKALIPKQPLEPSYLAAMLRAQEASILSQVSTAAHGTKKLDSRVLEDIRIPLPPLGEQRRIAAILDRADALRAKRRQIVAQFDSLSQSIFDDMFSDLVRQDSLRDAGVDFVSGKNVVSTDSNAHDTNRVLKVSAISSGRFLLEESKPMPADYLPPEAHRVKRGDILFGRASGSMELLGATAIVDVDPHDVFLPDKVWRLSLGADAKVSEQFALAVLRSTSARAFIRHNASGAAGVRNISKAKLLDYRTPIPPTALQKKFGERVGRVNAQRAASQRALAADDELFASLQSRAFLGEL